MSVRPISTRPLVHARSLCTGAADNLSFALAFEGSRDIRFAQCLDEAEAALAQALDMIRKARGPLPPVPPAAAKRADDHFNLACVITGAAPLSEVA